MKQKVHFEAMFYINHIICFLLMSEIVGISADMYKKAPRGLVSGLELPPLPSLPTFKNNQRNITKAIKEAVSQAATQYWKTFNTKKEGCMRKLRELKKTKRSNTQPEPSLLFWDQFGEVKEYIMVKLILW